MMRGLFYVLFAAAIVGCNAIAGIEEGKVACPIDGIQNGVESGVDCGGRCGLCADGLGCFVGDDCESGVCTEDICQAPSCSDEVLNGDEINVDCGGACDGCAEGSPCMEPSDCQSQDCTNNVCL
jgi:hypothetical protein